MRRQQSFETESVLELSPDLVRWESVYEKLFGHKPNLSQIVVPAKPEGQGPMRLIVILRGIIELTGNHPLQGTMDALKEHFPCWQYTNNLDESIVRNDRDPQNGSYAVWVKDVREADDENANKSANDLSKENRQSITVLERMLLEADYFFEHGEHMDQQNLTLCAGSRDYGGDVPGACWNVGKFKFFWCYPTFRYPIFRSRSMNL